MAKKYRGERDPIATLTVGVMVAIVVGALAWDLIPHWILYLAGGIVAAGAVVATVLLARRSRLIRTLRHLGETVWRAVGGSERNQRGQAAETMTPLSETDTTRLILAVGRRCENPGCQEPSFPRLEVHHIIPRRLPDGSNKLRNLVVLCPNCHAMADKGIPSQMMQQSWARRYQRFSQYHLVKEWDTCH